MLIVGASLEAVWLGQVTAAEDDGWSTVPIPRLARESYEDCVLYHNQNLRVNLVSGDDYSASHRLVSLRCDQIFGGTLSELYPRWIESGWMDFSIEDAGGAMFKLGAVHNRKIG